MWIPPEADLVIIGTGLRDHGIWWSFNSYGHLKTLLWLERKRVNWKENKLGIVLCVRVCECEWHNKKSPKPQLVTQCIVHVIMSIYQIKVSNQWRSKNWEETSPSSGKRDI